MPAGRFNEDVEHDGGKRYDLAVMGHRLAHGTFHESDASDKEAGFPYAIDLTPLADDNDLSLEDFTSALVAELAEEARRTIRAGFCR